MGHVTKKSFSWCLSECVDIFNPKTVEEKRCSKKYGLQFLSKEKIKQRSTNEHEMSDYREQRKHGPMDYVQHGKPSTIRCKREVYTANAMLHYNADS